MADAVKPYFDLASTRARAVSGKGIHSHAVPFPPRLRERLARALQCRRRVCAGADRLGNILRFLPCRACVYMASGSVWVTARRLVGRAACARADSVYTKGIELRDTALLKAGVKPEDLSKLSGIPMLCSVVALLVNIMLLLAMSSCARFGFCAKSEIAALATSLSAWGNCLMKRAESVAACALSALIVEARTIPSGA